MERDDHFMADEVGPGAPRVRPRQRYTERESRLSVARVPGKDDGVERGEVEGGEGNQQARAIGQHPRSSATTQQDEQQRALDQEVPGRYRQQRVHEQPL